MSVAIQGAVKFRKLTDLRENQIATIAKMEGEELYCRLLSLGIRPEEEIKLLRKSLFGSTYLIKCADSYAALRKAEAARIVLR